MYRPKLGHAHLFVRELQPAVSFYTSFLKLRVTETVADSTAFLSGSDLHHELALTAKGAGAAEPQPDGVGLFHLAFDVPDKRSFAEAYQALVAAQIDVSPVDHRIGWGMYFNDPDGNMLEIYCDTRGEPEGASQWRGKNRPLPHDRIMAELESDNTA